MQTDPRTVTHRWFEEVWNLAQEATIDELFAPDAIAYGLGEGGAAVRGPAEFKVFWRNMRAALPDAHIRIEDTLVDGDKCVVRAVMSGTHVGEGLGLPSTGRRVSITGIVIARVAHGQIVEGWQNWDQLGMLQQLGSGEISAAEDRFLGTGDLHDARGTATESVDPVVSPPR